jgi:hypothetical protein
MAAPWLRRSTGSPSGFSVGGGDTGFEKQNLTSLLGFALTGSTIKSAVLPKGTVIIAGIVLPKAPGNGDDFSAASAGQVRIGTEASPAAYMALTNANVYTRSAIASGVVLSEDTEVFFEPQSVTGVARGLLEVLLPETRP